ncbi:MAG: hypothetical protein CVU97_06320 [Firmicutes bacterium HGW-Firmicutes-21]|nr:MAG: hypothetical protein CVU97_06320 [Firmicutes bacterium HGW-Firmicutes-21]
MSTYVPIEGVITEIEPIRFGRDRPDNCCMLMMSVRGARGSIVNFIVDTNTYFIDNFTARRGDRIIAFYDSSLATPAIYPPQYRAVAVARQVANRFIIIDSFNRNFMNSGGSIRVNIGQGTRIIMTNNQTFLCDIVGRDVIVVYSIATFIFPAIINPNQIIVLCR